MELVKCGYGEMGEDCCLRSCGGEAAYRRCPLFDWGTCPFGRKMKGCGTCAHLSGMSQDGDGNRTVDCGANDLQMYQPYSTECKHWERALG